MTSSRKDFSSEDTPLPSRKPQEDSKLSVYREGDEYLEDFVDLLDQDLFKRKKLIRFEKEYVPNKIEHNIYDTRLPSFPSMVIKNHREVDPVIMFYLLCLYEGAFSVLCIWKNINADIPVFIKNQFEITESNYYNFYEYRSKHGRYYGNSSEYIDNDFMEQTMIGEEQKKNPLNDDDSYLILKYKDENDLQFRKVLHRYQSESEVNAIKSLISKYNIFDFILSFPSIHRQPQQSEHTRCLMRNVDIIRLGYQVFCHTMGINMDTDDSLTIQNIFDIETKRQAVSIFRKDIEKETAFIGANMEDILQYFPYSKVIDILPSFIEKEAKEYKKNPFDIPGDISIIHYSKYDTIHNVLHSTFLISDKKTKNVLLYDPHGFISDIEASSDELKMIFGDTIVVENIAKNLVLGLQHYDEEGYCAYFSLMFMIIFMYVYSWSRIDPVILLNCIESVIHDTLYGDENRIMELVKYFAFQMRLKTIEKQAKLYTPSNDNYTVFDQKEEKNISYIFSWFIVNLSTIIEKIDTNEYARYANNLLKTRSNMTIEGTSTHGILRSIATNDIQGILSCIGRIQSRLKRNSYGYVYTYCVMLQLNRLCLKLSKKLSIEHNNEFIFLGARSQFYLWRRVTKTDDSMYTKYVDPEFVIPPESNQEE